MERLRQRIALAHHALATLQELTAKPKLSVVERDAASQRFEYTFEAVWKTVQLYLREIEGLEVGSPKAAARASLQSKLLDEQETPSVLTMADDRNLTVHAYNEALAQEIAARIPAHAELLQTWLARLVMHAPDPAGAGPEDRNS